jgi:hypothetical protein
MVVQQIQGCITEVADLGLEYDRTINILTKIIAKNLNEKRLQRPSAVHNQLSKSVQLPKHKQPLVQAA